jgi:hypothetical protein
MTWPMHRALRVGASVWAAVVVSLAMYGLVRIWEQVPGIDRRRGRLEDAVEGGVPGKVVGKLATPV